MTKDTTHLRINLNLFTIGDSSDIRTWSNLPYFLSQSLINSGVQVNRINIIPHESLLYRLAILFRRQWAYLMRRYFYPHYQYKYPFFRTKLNYYLTNKKIKQATKLYQDADLNVFLTFSFSSYRYSSIPVVHYCDITYEHYLADSRREVAKRDRYFIGVEHTNLQNAHLVFGTSRTCCDFVRKHYNIDNVFELGGGINLENIHNLNFDEALAHKRSQNRILFIGRGVHKRGVDILVRAFRLFNAKNGHKFTLHLVGVTEHELDEMDDNIRLYGYLRKDDPNDMETYTNLLKSARLFLCPMREGPFPGAVREAQLMATPAIVADIWSQGKVIDGYDAILVNSLKPEEYADRMDDLVKNERRWVELAKNAHRAAKQDSWESVIKKFLKVVNEV